MYSEKDGGGCCGAFHVSEFDSPRVYGESLEDSLEFCIRQGYIKNLCYGFEDTYDSCLDPYDLNIKSEDFWGSVGMFKECNSGSFLVQVILTDDQLEYKDNRLCKLLKGQNFKFVTRWKNLNTDNYCNLFVKHDDTEEESSKVCEVDHSFSVVNT